MNTDLHRFWKRLSLGLILSSFLLPPSAFVMAADDFVTMQGGQLTQSGTGQAAKIETTSTGSGANKTHKLKTDGGTGGGAGGDASAANQITEIDGLDLLASLAGGTASSAPATDTADSGLNGRLQRIAQRITSLLAAEPGFGTATAPSTNVVTTQRPAVTQVVSTAFEASHILKASAGQLVQLSVYNSGPAQFLLLINSTTLPANGAVTLLYPPIPLAAGSLLVLDLPAPLVASTGIVVCNSSTGTFTKTIGSADLAIYAQVN